MQNAPTTPTAHEVGGHGSSRGLGFTNSFAKFTLGVETPSKLKNALGNQVSPSSTNNISGGLFAIYPTSKTQRSPASLYRFNRNYAGRQQSTNVTSGATEKPASFLTAVSQMRFNQPSQLKNHDDSNMQQVKSDHQDMTTGNNYIM